MTSPTSLLRIAGTAVFALAAATPAFASIPVPAPLVGAGLPALAIFGAGYWALRRFRRR